MRHLHVELLIEDSARDHLAMLAGRKLRVTLCYEAGYNGFWPAQFGAAG